MNAIVGYTGFVGSNLYTPERFRAAYNTKNIETAFGTGPDLLVYAGVRAEKYLANRDPERDLENIRQAEENIRRIAPKSLVLISPVDVLSDPRGADEDAAIDETKLQPYGLHRYFLERWTREYSPDALIVRLPGLFGKNLKKNFIYDFIHRIPSMLSAGKFAELSEKAPGLKEYYALQDNGFYKANVPAGKEEEVRELFSTLGFSALDFTDHRSRFQFYNLSRLWDDIRTARENHIRLLHLATEPVSAGEVYEHLTGAKFSNELDTPPACYDFRTKYDTLFGGQNGYICDRVTVMNEIREFVNV